MSDYVGVAIYAKVTGSLQVGPPMPAIRASGAPNVASEVAAWETERWHRAFRWPRALLPGLAHDRIPCVQA